jgi:hypothetical protein
LCGGLFFSRTERSHRRNRVAFFAAVVIAKLRLLKPSLSAVLVARPGDEESDSDHGMSIFGAASRSKPPSAFSRVLFGQ